MALLTKGFAAVKQKQQETEEAKKASQWRWFYQRDDKQEDTVRFLDEEPLTFYEHTFQTAPKKFESFVCTQDADCLFCVHTDNKASFKGAFPIIHRNAPVLSKNKDTGEWEVTGEEDQVKLYKQGQKMLLKLENKSAKKGLADRDYIITRLGKGTDTTYELDDLEPKKLTKKDQALEVPSMEDWEAILAPPTEVEAKRILASMNIVVTSGGSDLDSIG